MEKYNYSGKNKEEILNQIIEDLNCKEEDLVLLEKEEKKSLFGNKKIEIEAYKKQDIAYEVNKFLIDITKLMGIDIKNEIKVRNNTITLKLFSDKNQILIGKNGQTLNAMQLIVKQMLQNKYRIKTNIILDVENYKEKQLKNIEFIAKKTAREVQNTKIDAKLDIMNSYQRRAIHNVLTNYKNIKTESVGEEPNRYIIIKYVEKI